MLAAAGHAREHEVIDVAGVAIENLRQLDTVSALVSRAPIEAARLGFERCLISKVSDSIWIARAAHVVGDQGLADAMLVAGNRTPRVIDARLVEHDVLSRGWSLLVADAMRNDRVHPELTRLVRPCAYVVAPIVVRGAVVGLVHADTGEYGEPVNDYSRKILHLFASGIGMALETLYYREQLDRIRQQMDGLDSAWSTFVGDFERRRPETVSGAMFEQLTPRELEVLTHMADGDSNRRIAARLYVSEATVKAHVKHILRKLAASNRAEAVSRYLRAG